MQRDRLQRLDEKHKIVSGWRTGESSIKRYSLTVILVRAVFSFKEWTTRNAVPLMVVHIPRRRESFDPAWYGEMHQFLRANHIRFLDLTGEFEQRHIDPGELY